MRVRRYKIAHLINSSPCEHQSLKNGRKQIQALKAEIEELKVVAYNAADILAVREF